MLALSACGKIGFVGASEDARADVFDPPTPPTPPTGPFSTPGLVAELAEVGFDIFDPSLSEDGLEIVFARRPGSTGPADLWRATRASASSPWDPPAEITELRTASDEANPELSLDGLVMWFSSDRGATRNDPYVTTRADRQSAWTPPVGIAELTTTESEFGFAPSESQLELVFARGPAAGPFDLYVATRAATTEPWSAPAPLAELNSPQSEGDPHLRFGGRAIVFGTNRPGTQGGGDLWLAMRAASGAAFEAPAAVAELNSAADDRDPWLSSDLRTIVFASNRGGRFELFVAHR